MEYSRLQGCIDLNYRIKQNLEMQLKRVDAAIERNKVAAAEVDLMMEVEKRPLRSSVLDGSKTVGKCLTTSRTRETGGV